MFIVLTTYKKPIDDIEKHLPEHNQFLDTCYEKNLLIFSGRRNPRIGGVLLYNVGTKEEVKKIIQEDPFCRYELAEYDIQEFIPTKFSPAFSVFVN